MINLYPLSSRYPSHTKNRLDCSSYFHSQAACSSYLVHPREFTSSVVSLDLWLRLLRLHGRESEDLPDAVVVRQEHNHAVNAHTPATGRRKTMLESTAEGLVYELSLVITLVLLAGLLLEAQTLFGGDVQLSVTNVRLICCRAILPGVGMSCLRVANLLLSDEGLESLANARDGTRTLS